MDANLSRVVIISLAFYWTFAILRRTRHWFSDAKRSPAMPFEASPWMVGFMALAFLGSQATMLLFLLMSWKEDTAAPIGERENLNWPMIVLRVANRHAIDNESSLVWKALTPQDRDAIQNFSQSRNLPEETRRHLTNALESLTVDQRKVGFNFLLYPNSSSRQFFALVLSHCVFLGCAAVILLRNSEVRRRLLLAHRLRDNPAIVIGLRDWIAWQPTVIALSYIANQVFAKTQPHPGELFFLENHTPLGWFWLILSICVTAPITEELFFRGTIQSWFVKTFGAAVGIAGTGILFGMVHIASWPDPLALSALGIVLGISYHRTGSLYSPIIIHMGNNSVQIGLLILIKIGQQS